MKPATMREIILRVIIVSSSLFFFIHFLGVDFPFWAYILAILAGSALLPIGNPITIIIQTWTFILAIQQSVDIFSILFFIFFALYMLITFLPHILLFISLLIAKVSSNKKE